MHNKNFKPSVLCLINKEFSNSLEELKDYLDFSLIVCENLQSDILSMKYEALLIDAASLDEKDKKFVNTNIQKPKLFICSSSQFKNIQDEERVELPLNIVDLNKKIIQIIAGRKFAKNSSLTIKEYILDKNEKKITKDKVSITLTEKEIQLIELLSSSKEPTKKNTVLKQIWEYADDADTHTVETHIYRLRKKILDKFNDNDFIKNTKNGYLI